ncbi:MAG TPA: COX15/CtaA family protein [Anaeromyxobacteraceae bacterium]|nr:COX15/CtaA family protein [Anaeromyxobacteraceae bacterium]
MREHRFAVATAVATFVLLVIGGLVHPTGSSLACPDWPLCNGQFFPEMHGGVLYEHGHRLAALTVSFLTVSLAALVFRARRERSLRLMALGAVALVGVQASLGALTVVYKLPLAVSAGHLATSMAFFSLVIVLAHRLRPEGPRAPARPRRLVGLAAAATYLQIVLGALVRHTGSALACGTDVGLCEGRLWPAWGPAQVHMLHRLGGYAVAALVVAAGLLAWRAAKDGPAVRRRLALAAPALVLLQVGWGLLTVASYVSLPIVSLHLATGAALLADLLALFLVLGPDGARAGQPDRGSVGRLAPAAG